MGNIDIYWKEILTRVDFVKELSFSIFIKGYIKEYGLVKPDSIKYDGNAVWIENTNGLVTHKVILIEKSDYKKPENISDDDRNMNHLLRYMAKHVICDTFAFMDTIHSDDIIH